jgi:hypothetical protein
MAVCERDNDSDFDIVLWDVEKFMEAAAMSLVVKERRPASAPSIICRKGRKLSMKPWHFH